MVVKVKLDGLNIVRARGKWYVYTRETGKSLVKGFEGSRDDLLKSMEDADFLTAYNATKKRDLKRTYPDGTLGALIQWFENDCPKFKQLSDATVKDYRAAFLWLAPSWAAPLDLFTQPELYELRDRCANEKWPRFADKMISALSSMFSQAVKRGKMPMNPAKGIDKAAAADKNANREWAAWEVKAAIDEAPAHLKTPLILARYAGFRGQTIATLTWREYQDDPSFGKCFRTVTRKNSETLWVPATTEVQAHLSSLDKRALKIATKADGQPWDTEVQMQTLVSHYLRGLEEAGKIGPKTTLHGLRATYAAALRRDGVATGDVAAALGDRSERMGAHYTRHVENEAKVVRAFQKKQG
jgi:integrase